MGSEGSEFDMQEGAEIDDRDHLLRQRALLNEKLGFSKSGIAIQDLVSLDDMRTQINRNYDPNLRLMPVQDILMLDAQSQKSTDCSTPCSSSLVSPLSCREMNRARRKARQQNPTNSGGGASGGGGSSSSGGGGGGGSGSGTNSTSLSRSNSNSNGSLTDVEPERKKSKTTDGRMDNLYHSSGKSFLLRR